MTNEVILAIPEEAETEYYKVPIKKKDFGDFITNLLGQPETIEQSKTGAFEVNLEWLQNLHHVLDQRIKQQANAPLVDFSVEFRYRDAPHRKLNDLDSFLHFHETKKVTTKSLRIIWTYLIQFPNKPTPEKQEITLTIFSDSTRFLKVGNAVMRKETSNHDGLINFKIAHTERTWGDDIQAILEKEVSSVFIEKSTISSFFEKAIPLIALFIFFSGIIIPDYIKSKIVESDYLKLVTSTGIDMDKLQSFDIDKKIDLLIELGNPFHSFSTQYAWYQGVAFTAAALIAIYTLFAFEFDKPAFISITAEDQRRTEKRKKKDKWYALKKGSGYILAILAGVAGNYIYYILNVT
ncbi:hypothetical protein [Vibrio sp. MEBiC08052]|uniref:hypothetical protein n=1 Tax=Vibrio sp. MEBiC08052 TaxID=1761910 RepID=UPI000740826D|nr:hypothetical protein [Vibrio sp. MEBiC08052]KUI97156.1 hypothetical protein VRK_37400 [Vibrio sp. MEBiC08052]